MKCSKKYIVLTGMENIGYYELEYQKLNYLFTKNS